MALEMPYNLVSFRGSLCVLLAFQERMVMSCVLMIKPGNWASSFHDILAAAASS